MPTYEYECESCGLKFERRLAITDPPLAKCPKCGGKVVQLISGGSGFIIKGTPGTHSAADGACSFETSGKTCCGRNERCAKPPCEGDAGAR